MANIGFWAHKFIVIDAVPEQELHTAKRIYETIQDCLIQKASELTCQYLRCDSPTELVQTLDQVLVQCVNTGEIPFLHIEGHGEKEFFSLPNGSLKWETIFETIRKINIATRILPRSLSLSLIPRRAIAERREVRGRSPAAYLIPIICWYWLT